MVKLLLTTITIVSFLSVSTAQIVVGNSSASYIQPTYSLSWTIGEPVTATFNAPGVTLTNGFHQSNLLLTALDDFDQKAFVKVFPNPTLDILSLSVEISKPCYAILSSINGILLRSFIFTEQVQLDISHFQPGTYLLTIQSTDKKLFKTFKVMKVR